MDNFFKAESVFITSKNNRNFSIWNLTPYLILSMSYLVSDTITEMENEVKMKNEKNNFRNVYVWLASISTFAFCQMPMFAKINLEFPFCRNPFYVKSWIILVDIQNE